MTQENRFAGVYKDGTEVLDNAEQLLADGWAEKDIYLLIKDRGDLAILRYKILPDVKLADGTWLDYFEGFISGASHVKKAMDFQGFPEVDPIMIYEEIKNGVYLLYADRGELDNYYKENSEFKNAAPDPVIKVDATGVSGVLDSTPGAGDLENQDFPKKGDDRVAIDGQNIRREGDQVADPAAEVGYHPNYYKIGQDASRE